MAWLTTGSSMRPSLLPGAWVELTSITASEYGIGDVLALLGPDGQIVAHRLVRIEKLDGQGRLWTRGDGSPHLDPMWTTYEVVGRVSRGGRLGRAIARYPRLAGVLGAVGLVHTSDDIPTALNRALRWSTGRLSQLVRR